MSYIGSLQDQYLKIFDYKIEAAHLLDIEFKHNEAIFYIVNVDKTLFYKTTKFNYTS